MSPSYISKPECWTMSSHTKTNQINRNFSYEVKKLMSFCAVRILSNNRKDERMPVVGQDKKTVSLTCWFAAQFIYCLNMWIETQTRLCFHTFTLDWWGWLMIVLQYSLGPVLFADAACWVSVKPSVYLCWRVCCFALLYNSLSLEPILICHKP